MLIYCQLNKPVQSENQNMRCDFLSRKYIWKCHLQNVSHFVSASWCPPQKFRGAIQDISSQIPAAWSSASLCMTIDQLISGQYFMWPKWHHTKLTPCHQHLVTSNMLYWCRNDQKLSEITCLWFDNVVLIQHGIRYKMNMLYPIWYFIWSLLCFLCCGYISSFPCRFLWNIYPYPSGLLHWCWGNHVIAPVLVKQPWRIWVNTSKESTKNWS